MEETMFQFSPEQMLEFLPVAIRNRLPVLVQGAPGIGKTEILEEAARRAEADIIISHPVVSDPTDYKGQPWVINEEATFLPFSDLRHIIHADKPTVFFLDDFGQALPSVQAAAMQLILGRKINDHKVSEHVTFFAATNRKKDKAGVSGILEPVKSRFVTIIDMKVDHEDWIGWAINHQVPTPLISFIRFRPDLLFDYNPTTEIVNSPCPRTVYNVGRLIDAGISQSIELASFAGAAGAAFATEFVGFIRIFRGLPSIDKILMAPNEVDVPTDPATLYALCGALANKASEQTIKNIMIFGDKMKDEFNVLLVKDCIRHNVEVTETRAFIDWANKHKDVLI